MHSFSKTFVKQHYSLKESLQEHEQNQQNRGRSNKITISRFTVGTFIRKYIQSVPKKIGLAIVNL